MRKETSQWGKDVRKAAIDKDMSLKQPAENISYSYAVVSRVINGRYSNASYQAIAERINGVLGTTGLPERVAKFNRGKHCNVLLSEEQVQALYDIVAECESKSSNNRGNFVILL